VVAEKLNAFQRQFLFIKLKLLTRDIMLKKYPKHLSDFAAQLAACFISSNKKRNKKAISSAFSLAIDIHLLISDLIRLLESS